jgi:hypothetical protein
LLPFKVETPLRCAKQALKESNHMHATAAAALVFARPNRIHIRNIALVATVHAALLGITWYVTLNHNLENTIGQLFTFGFASPAKETFLTQTSAIIMSILSQPFAVATDHLPDLPVVPYAAAQLLGYTLLALNSVLWAAAIYVPSRLLTRKNRDQLSNIP